MTLEEAVAFAQMLKRDWVFMQAHLSPSDQKWRYFETIVTLYDALKKE